MLKYFDARFYKSCYDKDQLFFSNKKEVIFLGVSNVGKSSIINKILNRKNLAKTSKVPGKTESINFYLVDNIFFVDFPGYGFAKLPKFKAFIWDELAKKYFSSRKNLRLAVLVIDSRRGIKDLDVKMIEYLIYKNLPICVVASKIDKLNKKELQLLQQDMKKNLYLKDFEQVMCSSKTGYGIDSLKKIIKSCVD